MNPSYKVGFLSDATGTLDRANGQGTLTGEGVHEMTLTVSVGSTGDI